MSNKANIAKEISKNTNISSKECISLIDKFLSAIKENAKSKEVKISNFGTFFFKKTVRRLGRNPKTKESYIIPPMNKLSFRPSNKLRKNIN